MKVHETTSCDGVSLRPLLPADVTATYVGWLNDPEVARFTEIEPGETIESTRQYVKAAVADPNAAMWRITDLTHQRHVGNIRLSAISQRHQRAEVALMVGDKSFWGRGVATAAIKLVSDYGYDKLGLEKLVAGIYEANTGSRRAFEKAGYHLEATLKAHVLFEGERVDLLQMAQFAHTRGA